MPRSMRNDVFFAEKLTKHLTDAAAGLADVPGAQVLAVQHRDDMGGLPHGVLRVPRGIPRQRTRRRCRVRGSPSLLDESRVGRRAVGATAAPVTAQEAGQELDDL